MKKIVLSAILLTGTIHSKQKDNLAVVLSDIKFKMKSKSNHKYKPTTNKKSANKIIKIAKKRLGKKYTWGVYDCSKFVQDVMIKANNKKLPRTTRQQIKIGKHIRKTQAKKGDIIFFGDSKHYVGHTGIIINPQKKLMIHNSSAKGKVVISSYDTKYYRKKFRGIRRI